jgi:hypothetical protein
LPALASEATAGALQLLEFVNIKACDERIGETPMQTLGDSMAFANRLTLHAAGEAAASGQSCA